MKSLDARTWTVLDWSGAISLIVAAMLLAINAGLKETPALANLVPGMLDSAFMAYSPLALLGVFIIAVVARTGVPVTPEAVITPDKMGKIRLAGTSVFQLVPQHFTVELAAQLPYVEARFFVVNFLPRHIVLTHSKLSLQLYGAPALELIPLSQDDLVINPHEAPIIVCRRNLSDAERNNLPWRAGRNSASFELLAKAQDGDTSLSYGPVSSMAIDGWVNVPTPGQ